MHYNANVKHYKKVSARLPGAAGREQRNKIGGGPRWRLRFAVAGLGFAALLMGLMPAPRQQDGGLQRLGEDGFSNSAPTSNQHVTLPLALPATIGAGPTNLTAQPANAASELLSHSERSVWPMGEARSSPSLDLKRHTVTVSRGDSLSSIFKALGLPQGELHRLLSAGENGMQLSLLHEGQQLELDVDTTGRIKRLVLDLDATDALHVVAVGDEFRSHRVQEVLDRRMATATGTIISSLFLAGKEAGLSDSLIMAMVEIFGWDVDFALDIREGDRFTVIYEEFFKDGDKLHDGDILAAEFVNQGRSIRTVRYADASGHSDYYAPDGRSMHKAFLRTPVKFSRISSKFTQRRWHPVLHRFRSHRGVDYAAPTGTPVKVTGNGKVIFSGYKGGYGRTVMVQHGEQYTTVYAHLSRFAKGLRQGRRVRQGQVIGYVGQSGLASGPHLHYEFRVNGAHRDPLRVSLPKAAPISPQYRADFLTQTQPLLAQLEVLARLALAKNEN